MRRPEKRPQNGANHPIDHRQARRMVGMDYGAGGSAPTFGAWVGLGKPVGKERHGYGWFTMMNEFVREPDFSPLGMALD
jgi:hypothetical protein